MRAKVGKIYEHYKGNFYTVIAIALHSETKEELVIYKELKKVDTGKFWARPRKMFEEVITVGGKKIPRFK